MSSTLDSLFGCKQCILSAHRALLVWPPSIGIDAAFMHCFQSSLPQARCRCHRNSHLNQLHILQVSACVMSSMIVLQLSQLGLYQNRLNGTLPSSWSSLKQVRMLCMLLLHLHCLTTAWSLCILGAGVQAWCIACWWRGRRELAKGTEPRELTESVVLRKPLNYFCLDTDCLLSKGYIAVFFSAKKFWQRRSHLSQACQYVLCTILTCSLASCMAQLPAEDCHTMCFCCSYAPLQEMLPTNHYESDTLSFMNRHRQRLE